MKKILFAIAIVMMLGMTANAQRKDGFFSSYDNYYNRQDMTDPNNVIGWDLPNGGLVNGGEYGNDEPAPLGSGLLVLTALGVGYAVARKKK